MPRRQEIEIEEESSLRIRIPSITLNRNDIRDLWKILERAKDNSTSSETKLYVSGNKENITTKSIDRLISARWPQDVDIIELLAYGDKNGMKVTLENHPEGVNRIEISGLDSNWVSARAKEVDDFISEHKSWYWIFHNITTIFLGTMAFAILVGFGAKIRLDLSFENTLMAGVFGLMAIMLVTMYGLRPLYPFIYVNSGNRSFKAKIRGLVNWIMLTIVGGLLFNALSALWIR